ncbi:hypothetical protein Pelo_12614 [Pelomyxa schiedti]|nr:hypothetical protein Pelo_12614 [Pelomyxa schiedti]
MQRGAAGGLVSDVDGILDRVRLSRDRLPLVTGDLGADQRGMLEDVERQLAMLKERLNEIVCTNQIQASQTSTTTVSGTTTPAAKSSQPQTIIPVNSSSSTISTAVTSTPVSPQLHNPPPPPLPRLGILSPLTTHSLPPTRQHETVLDALEPTEEVFSSGSNYISSHSILDSFAIQELLSKLRTATGPNNTLLAQPLTEYQRPLQCNDLSTDPLPAKLVFDAKTRTVLEQGKGTPLNKRNSPNPREHLQRSQLNVSNAPATSNLALAPPSPTPFVAFPLCTPSRRSLLTQTIVTVERPPPMVDVTVQLPPDYKTPIKVKVPCKATVGYTIAEVLKKYNYMREHSQIDRSIILQDNPKAYFLYLADMEKGGQPDKDHGALDDDRVIPGDGTPFALVLDPDCPAPLVVRVEIMDHLDPNNCSQTIGILLKRDLKISQLKAQVCAKTKLKADQFQIWYANIDEACDDKMSVLDTGFTIVRMVRNRKTQTTPEEKVKKYPVVHIGKLGRKEAKLWFDETHIYVQNVKKGEEKGILKSAAAVVFGGAGSSEPDIHKFKISDVGVTNNKNKKFSLREKEGKFYDYESESADLCNEIVTRIKQHHNPGS